MPSVSRSEARHVERVGPLERRFGEVDGYTVSFERYTEDQDYAPLVRGLPGDRCPSPHWGIVLKGKLVYRYGDHEDVITAGRAFYAPPGHTAWLAAGTELVKFSPTEELQETFAATRANLAEMLD